MVILKRKHVRNGGAIGAQNDMEYFSLTNMAGISWVLRHEVRDDILHRKLKGLCILSLEEVDFIFNSDDTVYMLCCITLCAYGAKRLVYLPFFIVIKGTS